ncbi:uncharacterized protein LOC125210273 [Salvia hispanica]|uniref:uncharacterized protein LOC125210273 n=1 Tax=Salvia hispanica TaxID=49212 RepID=UPI00200986F5|nr:uncharacterized protein LOC125210273 [Salvia hispanica]
MFLTVIVPSPKNPKQNIDVFLQSLIAELNDLWTEGIPAYDISRKQNFQLRAALMWTISDFPALHPTGVVANICNKAFKHIVDPRGYSQAKLSEEYIEHYWKEFEKAFRSQCKARYGDYIGYKRKTMKKPAYFTDVQWTTYIDAWKLPENIKVSERCSRNRRQGREKAFGKHCNGCVPFEEIVEKMIEENDEIMLQFMDVYGRTHTFKKKDSQGLVSQRATQIRDDVRTRAEELRVEGVENPDLDAIFLERHGKVKKRKQIPGAESATKLY